MISGFLLVNKDSGISSSRVVQILKKKFNLKKVGHLGTLDPMATGLLIIAINRATKFASLLLQSEKSYRAEVTLGTQTDTDDAEGEVISTKKNYKNISEVTEALLTFLGESEQLPPNYSALKHKGKPMYKYARDGIKVDKPHELDLKIKEMLDHNGPVIFDCQVDPNENCFPMIPSGKPHNQMILGPNDKKENKITGKGKALV